MSCVGNFLERKFGLRLGCSWKRVSLPEPFLWTDMSWKTFIIFDSDLDLKMNWLEVGEKSVVVVCLWVRQNLTYSRGWRFVLHTSTPSFFTYSVLPVSCAKLPKIVRIFFRVSGCVSRYSKYAEIWNPSKNAPHDFRNRACTQIEGNCGFWTEEAKKAFTTMMCAFWVDGGPPIKPKRVFVPLWMSERFEGLPIGEGWRLTPARYTVRQCIVNSPVIGPFEMMWSTSSVLRKMSIASFGLGRTVSNASITTRK